MIGPRIIDAMDRVGIGSARVRSAWDAALPQTVYQFSQIGDYAQSGFTDLQTCYEQMLQIARAYRTGHWRICALTPRLGLLRPTPVRGKRKWFVAEAWAINSDIQGIWNCTITSDQSGEGGERRVRMVRWDHLPPPGLSDMVYDDVEDSQ